jgi:hypothetical protein
MEVGGGRVAASRRQSAIISPGRPDAVMDQPAADALRAGNLEVAITAWFAGLFG